MNNMNRLRICHLLACMMAAGLGYGSQAIADGVPSGKPDFVNTYAAGLACNFELRIEGWNGKGGNGIKQFTAGGIVVRELSAGTGSTLRYTNTETGNTISTISNGAATDTRYNLDGSFTQTDTGHNVLILFPSDTPPGPSTTLYVGKLVFDSTPTFDFTVRSESGNKTDICAALS